MFAPQQAVRLGRYIAWQASLGQAPLRRLEAGQSCAVTEVQLDEHCSLLTAGNALSGCIILVRDVKACDVREVVLQASSTLRASVLFLIGSLQPFLGASQTNFSNVTVYFTDPATAAEILQGTHLLQATQLHVPEVQ